MRGAMFEFFEPHFMQIAERAPNHTLIHAGVVSFRGHGIMLTGYGSPARLHSLPFSCVRAAVLLG